MQRIKSIVRWFANTPFARSLRFRLISIVLLASLPTIALLFLTASQARGDAINVAQDEAQRIATQTATQQAREMDRVERELFLLSRLPEVKSDNSAACTEFFESLVEAPDNPIYVDLRVIGLDGKVHCRSAVSNPLGPNEDREFINQAIRQRTFTVGAYRINPLNDHSIISFAAPVENEDGSSDRAIVATLDLGEQALGLEADSLPTGSVLSMVRDDGMLLLQEPPQDEVRVGVSLVGTPAVDAALTEQIDAPDDAWISASAPIAISAPQPNGIPAHIVVQIPEAEIVRRADDAFKENLAKLGVAAAIAVLAAWISADLFTSRDSETRKTIVAELYHSFSSGIVDHLDTIVDTNVTDHAASSDQAKGLDGLKQTIAAFRYAFPDGEVVPREMLADRDKVIVRVSLTGTQVGEFQGIAPSGTRMIADGIETFSFRDGLISEIWSLMGPLLPMSVVEHPEEVEIEPAPVQPSFFKRVRRRLGRRGKDDAT